MLNELIELLNDYISKLENQISLKQSLNQNHVKDSQLLGRAKAAKRILIIDHTIDSK